MGGRVKMVVMMRNLLNKFHVLWKPIKVKSGISLKFVNFEVSSMILRVIRFIICFQWAANFTHPKWYCGSFINRFWILKAFAAENLFAFRSQQFNEIFCCEAQK